MLLNKIARKSTLIVIALTPLIFGCSSSNGVKTDSSDKKMKKINSDLVASVPNEEAILNFLIRTGKVTEDMTEEQKRQAIREYVKGSNPQEKNKEKPPVINK
ncbi:hypothetical protein [Veronia pacifica]|uniref:Lipoprotein n=1 Tax=Veronia pacifica TaxID=1080227 RepID=A0A1C3EAP9_9GAMM|nr:hypothetical protein [Veronia pacifica]ODA30280.1 hypothetical protein A8L45_20320 [Veronia pacifica]